MKNFVVIDLGSNSIRLKITKIYSDGKFKELMELKQAVRLAENMGPEMTLKKIPMERTMDALLKFKKEYSKLDNLVLVAIATAAVRQAKNQREFLDSVYDKVGIKFDVISGKEEAFLDYLGVIKTLNLNNCVIIDTGGASTEIILVKDKKAKQMISLPFGSVTISSKFGLEDKICAKDLFKAMTFLETELTKIKWLDKIYELPIVALGGSNRTIAKIARRKDYSKEKLPDLHGYYLRNIEIFELMGKLISLSKVERQKIDGLAKERADVIIGGLIPLILLLRIGNISEVIFSNHGLREGSLFKYLEK